MVSRAGPSPPDAFARSAATACLAPRARTSPADVLDRATRSRTRSPGGHRVREPRQRTSSIARPSSRKRSSDRRHERVAQPTANYQPHQADGSRRSVLTRSPWTARIPRGRTRSTTHRPHRLPEPDRPASWTASTPPPRPSRNQTTSAGAIRAPLTRSSPAAGIEDRRVRLRSAVHPDLPAGSLHSHGRFLPRPQARGDRPCLPQRPRRT